MAPTTTDTKTKQNANTPAASLQRPVEILSDQLATLASNIQPVLLLSLIVINFKSLVREPVSTLLGLAPATAIVQLAYCVLCLPTSTQTSSMQNKPGQKKKTRPIQDLSFRAVPAFLSLVLTVFLTTPTLYIAVILFGGPMVSETQATLLLALHFALLTTPPLFYVHGLEAEKWLRIASLQLVFDEVYGMSLGACLGAWLGAIPIPLDWDRDWQRWPVTVVVGVYLGAVVGKVAGRYVLKGLHFKIT